MTPASDPPPSRKRKTPVLYQPLGVTTSRGTATKLVSLLRSRLLNDQPPPPLPEYDALRWKQKAKERKVEILRFRADLMLAEEASRSESFSQVAAYKCYFFDDLGKLSRGSHDYRGFSDVLRRRFLRQVRYQDSLRRSDDACGQQYLLGGGRVDEVEQFSAAIDFLTMLCDTVSLVMDVHFANWSHQAVDFMLESISRDQQFNIQHLTCKLGSESDVGQRVLLAVSQKVHLIAKSLLFVDPFDERFPVMHQSMYILIKLLELLVCDYLLAWSKDASFNHLMFEEWLTSIVHSPEAVGLLESRNNLYMYMNRLVGELSRLIGQVPSFSDLNHDTLNKLFR